MISQFERYGFLGEVRVYTFRNLFKNQVPLGLQLFDKLHTLHIAGSVHVMNRAPKSIRIHEFQISNSRYAEILFQLTDPSIPDNVLSDRNNGGLRVAKRKITEDPAVSAHMVLDLNPKFDNARKYPACIENIDYLSRSLIIDYFNEWMAKSLSQQIVRKGEKKAKTFQPRFEFVAPASQTIQDALENGGVLRGVKWVEDEVDEQTFGDKSYPLVKRTDVGIKVKNRPTGDAAKKMVSDLYGKFKGQPPKALKVTIEDENERLKTVGIDPSKNNALSSVFIAQAHFDNFTAPLSMCERKIRGDLAAKMKKALSS
ncbi:hypothetical protein [Thalassovita sp.]|uniref:hypothetical protein n=1 Tax=Thalassovita sp. TaxID=1979401 RepID=UPI002AB27A39|nr:hypothetical protein [Thalassovita sp.]